MATSFNRLKGGLIKFMKGIPPPIKQLLAMIAKAKGTSVLEAVFYKLYTSDPRGIWLSHSCRQKAGVMDP